MVPQTLKIVPSSSLQDDNNKDSKLYQHLFCKNCKRNTKHCVHLARVRERHEREHNGAVLHSRYARGVTSYNGQTYRAAILCIFNSVLRGWRYARWRSDGTNSQYARSMLGGSIFKVVLYKRQFNLYFHSNFCPWLDIWRNSMCRYEPGIQCLNCQVLGMHCILCNWIKIEWNGFGHVPDKRKHIDPRKARNLETNILWSENHES